MVNFAYALILTGSKNSVGALNLIILPTQNTHRFKRNFVGTLNFIFLPTQKIKTSKKNCVGAQNFIFMPEQKIVTGKNIIMRRYVVVIFCIAGCFQNRLKSVPT